MDVVTAPSVAPKLSCFRILACSGVLHDAETKSYSYIGVIDALFVDRELLGQSIPATIVAGLSGHGNFDVAAVWASSDGGSERAVESKMRVKLDGVTQARFRGLRLPRAPGLYRLTLEWRVAPSEPRDGTVHFTPWQPSEASCPIPISVSNPVAALPPSEEPLS